MIKKRGKLLGRAVPGVTGEVALSKLLMGARILYVYDRDSSMARYSLVFGDESFRGGRGLNIGLLWICWIRVGFGLFRRGRRRVIFI